MLSTVSVPNNLPVRHHLIQTQSRQVSGPSMILTPICDLRDQSTFLQPQTSQEERYTDNNISSKRTIKPIIPVQPLQTCLNLTFQSEITNLKRLANWDQITFSTGIMFTWIELNYTTHKALNAKTLNSIFKCIYIYLSKKMQTTIVSLWLFFTIQLQIKDQTAISLETLKTGQKKWNKHQPNKPFITSSGTQIPHGTEFPT